MCPCVENKEKEELDRQKQEEREREEERLRQEERERKLMEKQRRERILEMRKRRFYSRMHEDKTAVRFKVSGRSLYVVQIIMSNCRTKLRARAESPDPKVPLPNPRRPRATRSPARCRPLPGRVGPRGRPGEDGTG